MINPDEIPVIPGIITAIILTIWLIIPPKEKK